ncbi:MAG: MFS transporter [Dehalococcoidia bacterium]|nr:MFS transporter [Dehalococcoidia bacterium]
MSRDLITRAQVAGRATLEGTNLTKARAPKPATPLGLIVGHSQFRLLFLATTMAQLAFGMMSVAQGVLAFDLTGRNSAVGFVSLGQGLSMVALGPLGGALSDRISKRRLLLMTETSIGSMYAIIAGLVLTGTITIWFLATATLILGAMYAIMVPTRQAWIGDMLDGRELVTGIALQQLMNNATRIVGPLAAGALIALDSIGTGGTYTTMAAIFVFVVVVLALTEPTPPRARKQATSVASDLAGGLTYVWASPQVRLLILVFAGVVLSGFSYQIIMPGFLENELGRPASLLGWIYGAAAAGGVVTTLLILALGRSGNVRVMFGFGAALGVSLLLLSLAPSFGLTLVIAALIGASSSGFQMLNNINLMQRADPRFFGRVMAVAFMAMGIGSILAYPIGIVADHSGERATMALLGAACLGIVVIGVGASRSRFPK